MTGKATNTSTGGELPLGYITWFLYALVLAIKMVILFGHPYYIAQQLDSKPFFGSNVLKITIALAAIIFFLFIETHNDAPPESDRQGFLNAVTAGATMDILDTVQLLDVLFIQESHLILPYSIDRAIVGIAFINLLLPTILLLIFSRTRYGKGDMPKKLKLFHKMVYVLLVNVPMFIIRGFLWRVKLSTISVFIIKNVMSIGFALKDIAYQFLVLGHTDKGSSDDVDTAPEEIEMSGFEEPPRKSPMRSHHPGISAEI